MTTRQVSLLVWSVLAVAFVTCEVAAVLSSGAVPRFAAVVRAVVAKPVARVVLLLFWMWLAWHLFVR